MREAYFRIYTLLGQLGNPLPRWNKIHEIVKRPNFQYKKEEGADIILSMFLRSSYWLDKELFDETYLYTKENNILLPMQRSHLKMVEIGVSLLDKGFPLEYTPSEYDGMNGLSLMGTYVKTFIKQCHKKYAFSHKKELKKQNDLSI